MCGPPLLLGSGHREEDEWWSLRALVGKSTDSGTGMLDGLHGIFVLRMDRAEALQSFIDELMIMRNDGKTI